ncbi:MAG TPA: CocE/NonD family hydrolase [Dehalococcoidia bacterium]|nr:CocE/NonD family hydrolase [Dehalococcoidia bacterium]
MSSSILIDSNVPMEMRDGMVLRADIYRPDDDEKHPAIFMRAYRKVFGRVGHLDIFAATRAGYALVTQVIRGRGSSEGEWHPEEASTVESQDGYDSVEWIAEQRWCDGNVGMMGYSHAGGMAAQTAMMNPPHLKAIAPWSSGVGQRQGGPGGFRPPNTGGAISFITALLWLPNEAADVVNRLERQGQDVTEMRRSLEWARTNPEEYYNFLPLKDVPFAQFERIGQLWQFRLRGVPQTEEAKEVKTYERVMVPCSHLTGWYDGVSSASFESFMNMRTRGGSQLAREGQHIISGPWAHLLELGNHLGAMNYGAGLGRPPSNHLIDFFNRYLRGEEVRIPPVMYFLMGRNEWHEADSWPLSQTQWQRFYLHSQGSANTSSGDGLLSRDEPSSEQPDTFTYDPHNPVPTVGGGLVGSPAGLGFTPGPLEQSAIERRNDVLCYTTPELKEDIEITGPIEVHVFAATSARDTDFTAKLVDVYPDGRSLNLVDGIKRARGLKSEYQPELISPDEIKEYVITLGPTSQLFRRDHRIRVDISSSNFPLYDRNMNTGNHIGEDSVGIPAKQTVYHEADYASYIDLPVIPDK